MVVALGDEQLALHRWEELAGALSGALTSSIREPMVCGVLKSNGVPLTGTWASGSGIWVGSVGE